MVSKNNFRHKMEADAKRVPHFALRKLSIGVASVLLSTTLYFGMSANASTDVPASTNGSETAEANANAKQEYQPAQQSEAASATAATQSTASESAAATDTAQSAAHSQATSAAPVQEEHQAADDQAASASNSEQADTPVEAPVENSAENTLDVNHQAGVLGNVAQVLAVDASGQPTQLQDPAASATVNVPYKAGTDGQDDEYNKYITRTIKITAPDGAVTGPLKQTVHYIRKDANGNAGTKDTATGQITWVDWSLAAGSTAKFDAYDLPQHAGYLAVDANPGDADSTAEVSADGKQIVAINIDPSYTSHEIDVKYIPLENVQAIHVVDDDSNENIVKDFSVTGKTGTDKDVSIVIPDGYKLVEGQTLPTKVHFTGNALTPINIHVKEVVVTVTPDLPRATTDIIPGTQNIHFPSGVAKADLEHTITRNTVITKPDGSNETRTDSVVFDRTAKVNAVTGAVAYSDWPANQRMNAVTADAIPGYRVVPDENAGAIIVTPNNGDLTAHITYEAVDQEINVNFVDENGENVGTDTVENLLGNAPATGSTVTLTPENLNDGLSNQGIDGDYELAPNQGNVSYVVTADPAQEINIHVVAKTEFISHDDPKTTDDTTSDGMISYPEGLTKDDLNKTVKRVVTIVAPDGTRTPKVQTVTFTRDATLNLADNYNGADAVTYTAWSENGTHHFDEVVAPAIPGYKPTQPAPAIDVTPDSQDSTATITYVANAQIGKISYVDDHGAEVGKTDLTGTTDQEITITPKAPAGWKIIPGQNIPSTKKVPADGIGTIIVKVEHGKVTVPSTDPKIPNDKLPDNPGKNYPSGVDHDSLNYEATRTINVVAPNGHVTTEKQTAKIHRDATIDEVTGDVTYGNWSQDSWAAYNVPAIAGYTAGQSTVPTQAVDSATTDVTVTVNYIPDAQTGKISYVDANNHSDEIANTPLNGTTDQTIQIASKVQVPAGWHPVAGQHIPDEMKIPVNGIGTIIVYIEHSHVTVTPNNPKDPGKPLPDNPGENYPSGVDHDSLNKTITRTVNVTKPDGTHDQPVVQKVTVTRTADIDEVSGKVSYSDWTTGTWAEFTPQTIAGYTLSQTKVAAQNVNHDTSDATVNISYAANDHEGKIVYIDLDNNNHEVGSTRLTGKTGQTIAIHPEIPGGYVIANGQTIPANENVTANGIPQVTINLHHGHVTVTSDQPKTTSDPLPDNQGKKFPAGVDHDSLNKTVTRTIVDHVPHQNAKTTIQTVNFTRDADIDEVTGDVTYKPWVNDSSFGNYVAVGADGYEPSVENIAAKTPQATDADSTIDITYRAVAGSQTIQYVDSKHPGTVAGSQTFTGNTDQTVPVSASIPAGWQLVAGQHVPSEVTIHGVDRPIQILVEHRVVTVTPNDPKTPSDKMPDNTAVNFPAGVDHDSLNKTLYRDITIVDPHTGNHVTPQSVVSTRTAEVDEVTGQVVKYGDWSNVRLPEFRVPAVAGYTPSQDVVTAVTVNGESKPKDVTVTYTANHQTGKISYVDGDGNEVGKTDLTGVTDQDIMISPVAPAGWKISEGQNIVPSEKATAAGIPTVTVKVEHGHVMVTPNDPKTPSDKLPDNPGKNYPSGVDHDSLNKTITRNITVVNPHTGNHTTTQRVESTRTADIDEVTGNVTYGAWTKGDLAEFTAPEVAGYTPDKATISKLTVDGNSRDSEVKVTYTADHQTGKISYVDGDGNEVGKTDLTGVTDQDVTIAPVAPAGWKISEGQNIVPSEKATATGIPTVTVKVEHGHTTVTPNDPKTPSDKLPDNSGKNYPSGVDHDSLNKTVIRTITVNTPNAIPSTITQKASLSRTADVDEVSGKVTYGEWQLGENGWKEYDAPVVAGYIPVTAKVNAVTPNGDTTDAHATINYTANAQTGKISYVDGDGNEVGKTDLTGVTDQVITINPKAPAGWKISEGQTIVHSKKATATGIPTVTVKVEHGHVTVTPNDPKTPSDKLPDNPGKNYPSGVDHDSLNKTIARTIIVVDPHTGSHTTIQRVVSSRTADIDEVTGNVTYGAWTSQDLPEFTTPEVAGYTPSQAKVDKLTVTGDSNNSEVEIIYTANHQTGKISYVDGDGNEVGKTDLTGVTDQDIAISPVAPAGWKISEGQNIVPSEKATATGIPTVTVKVEHGHVTVTPNDPKTPSDKLPDNPGKNYPSGVDHDSLNKTITRNITVVDPHTGSHTTTQRVESTRTADIDEVTGNVTYGAWTKGDLAEFTAPEVAGYTPDKATISKLTVDGNSSDVTVEIHYTANDQTGKISYVDQNGKEIANTPLTGTTDSQVSVNPQAPAGWKITQGQNIPPFVTVTPNEVPTVKVTIEHGHTMVIPNDPKTPSDKLPDNPGKNYPSGVDRDSLNKTVIRTITVVDPHTGNHVTTQTAHLSRIADVDEVTNDVHYGDWNVDDDGWQLVAVPEVPGYTASQNQVLAENVDGNTTDKSVMVTYEANDGTQTIKFVDRNGGVIKIQTVNGKTDEHVNVPNSVPAGWKVVEGQTVPTEVVINSTDTPIDVTIEHKTVTVEPGKGVTPGTSFDPSDPTGPKYPNGVTNDDLNRTIDRTITVNVPGQQPVQVTQSASFKRGATVDEVSGAVTYTDWTIDHNGLTDYAAPVVPGYTVSQASVAGVNNPTIDTKLNDVVITYSANDQSGKISYVDGDGNEVTNTPLTGKTDQGVAVKPVAPTGWKLVPGQNVPAMVIATPNGVPTVTVKVEHGHVTVTPNDPKTSSDKLPDNPGETYPTGVDHDSLNKTVTRTITVNMPDGSHQAVTQTAELSRTADIDEVTKAVTYGDWFVNHNGWTAYAAPEVAGYTADKTVDAVTVNGDTQDANVAISYTANDQTTEIVYKDGDKVIKRVPLTGKTGEIVPVPTDVPDGYHVDGQVPGNYTFGGSDNPDVVITLGHNTTSVSDSKTVTRTINVKNPDGSVKTTIQKAELTRTGSKDVVTSEITWGDWTNGNWDEFDVPAIAGYTPSQAKINGVVVNGDIEDVIINVDYSANDQTTEIVYKDGDKVVKRVPLTGKTGETVKVPTDVPAGFHVDGKVPGDYTFGGDENPEIVISLGHDTETVSDSKTVTRTINVKNPDGSVKTTTQKAELTRTGSKDAVTGETTWSDWTKGSWDEFDVPAVAGYTPSQVKVAGMTVDGDTVATTVDINYVADEQTQEIKFVDPDGNPVGSQTITGKTGETVDVNLDIPDGYEVVDGDDVPSTVTMVPDGDPITVKVQKVEQPSNPDDQPEDNGNGEGTVTGGNTATGEGIVAGGDNNVAIGAVSGNGNATKSSESQGDELPQTGNAREAGMLAGLGALGMALGLAGLKRKKKQD